MAIQSTPSAETPSSFHYAAVLGPSAQRDMADAEHIIANLIASGQRRMGPDGFYIYGRHGTPLTSLQVELGAFGAEHVSAQQVPGGLPLLRAYLSHTPIHDQVAGLAFPTRVEEGPVIRIDPYAHLPYPRPH